MLKQRIYTAVCLATILFLVLWSQSNTLFGLFLVVFFGAAAWENARLFKRLYPGFIGVVSAVVLALLLWLLPQDCYMWFAIASVALWVFCLIPSLFSELPEPRTPKGNRYQRYYWFSILSSFLSVYLIYRRSAILLLSIMMIVWLADIGAYFAGRALGRHKLAPAISPGKTWEGAIGGVIAVLVVAVLAVKYSWHPANIATMVYARYGMLVMVLGLIVLAALSILGDLLESKLKRRAGIKDSSNLLPGHGGVLDRVDSLIPVLPLAVLLGVCL